MEGGLQGRLPPDAAEPTLMRLRERIESSCPRELHLTLESEGERFTLRADGAIRPLPVLPEQFEDEVADMIEEIAALLPRSVQGDLFSTLRTVRFGAGEQIETGYLLREDRSVTPQTRRVQSATASPMARPPDRRRLMGAALALLVAAAVLAVSPAFVDWGRIREAAGISPADSELVSLGEVGVSAGPYASFLDARVLAVDLEEDVVTIELTRVEDAWRRRVEPSAMPPSNGIPWSEFLALANLHRGVIPVELMADGGQVIGQTELDVRDLFDRQSIRVVVPIPRQPRTREVRFGL